MSWSKLVGVGGLLFVGGVACGVSEGNFPSKYGEAMCDYWESCQASAFNEYYTSMDDCRSEWEDALDGEYDDCDFDKAKAKDCLDAIDKAAKSCDSDDAYDSYDPCSEVYDNC